jgi:hypothetical protein
MLNLDKTALNARLDRLCVDRIVFRMRTNEADVDGTDGSVLDCDNEAVVIPADIEYRPIAYNDVG